MRVRRVGRRRGAVTPALVRATSRELRAAVPIVSQTSGGPHETPTSGQLRAAVARKGTVFEKKDTALGQESLPFLAVPPAQPADRHPPAFVHDRPARASPRLESPPRSRSPPPSPRTAAAPTTSATRSTRCTRTAAGSVVSEHLSSTFTAFPCVLSLPFTTFPCVLPLPFTALKLRTCSQ